MVAENIPMPGPIHRYRCRVIYGDTDSGGVVYYANYLRYFEAGRTEMMRDMVSSYKELEDMGYILPVVECYVKYRASAFYDDLLVVETSLVEVKKVSCRFHYRIIRENDGKLLATGYTVHAAVNRDGKLTKLPADFVERLKKAQDQSL